jgi:hypothetical protein
MIRPFPSNIAHHTNNIHLVSWTCANLVILSHDSVGNEDQTVTRKETRDSNQMEKQKIPHCWNSPKANQKYHTVGIVQRPIKNTTLLE